MAIGIKIGISFIKSIGSGVVALFQWGTATDKNWGESTTENWG